MKLGKRTITENDIKALAKKAFDALGGWSYGVTSTAMGVHGIPDRVGCIPVVVTQDMVGKTVGLFAAIECKRPGRRNEENAGFKGNQIEALRGILRAAGIALGADNQADVDLLGIAVKMLRSSPHPGYSLQEELGGILNDRIGDHGHD
jgi:hypothetical protein